MALKLKDYNPAAKFGAGQSIQDLTAAYTLVNEDSGTMFRLNLAAGFAVTLPLPSVGLTYEFFVGTAPTGSYTIVTNGAAAILNGKATNSAAGSGSTSTTGTTITFVLNQAVIGDYVKVFSDGTYWYATGISKVAAGITFA
jgi:hypothetical protein